MEKQFRILIIDNKSSDVTMIRSIIKNQLGDCIFKISDSYEDYLKILDSFNPEIIITECSKNNLDIEAITSAAKKRSPFIAIMILTDRINEDAALQLTANIADDYVLKDDMKRLGITVQRLLNEKQLSKELYFAERDLDECMKFTIRYRHWEANVPAVVFFYTLHTDGTQNFTYVSPVAKRILGLEPDDIVRDLSVIRGIAHPDDLPGIRKAIQQSALTMESFSHECRLDIKGDYRMFKFTAKPARESNGDIVWNGILIDINEQRVIEESLDTERSLLEILMNNLPDAIYFKDLESRFIKVNKGFIARVNVPSENDLIGKTDFDLYDHEHANDARNDELNIIKTGKPVIGKFEKEVLPDGHINWVTSTKLPLKDKDGNIIGTFGVSRDITQLILLEQSLTRERNLLSTLIDALPDDIYIKDCDGRFLLNNKAHLKTLGVKSQAEALGRTDFDFLSNEEASKITADDIKVVNQEEILRDQEEESYGSDGIKKWHLSTKVPLYDDEGKIMGMVGISHDITESKLIQEKLKSSEERLRHLISSTSSVLYTLRPLGKNFTHVWIGRNIEQYGYSQDEIINSELWSYLIHPDDIEFYNTKLKCIFETGKEVIDYRFRHKDGNYFWLRDEMVYIKNESDDGYEIVGSVLDITDRLKAEEALLHSEAQLSNALKIAHLAYWEFDVYKDLFTFNDQFYILLRTSVEKEGGYTMTSRQYTERFVHPDDRRLIAKKIHFATEPKEPSFTGQVEHRIIYGDGEIGHISAHYFMERDIDGNTVKVFGANQDITKRRKAEEALRASEYLLKKSQSVGRVGSFKFDFITNGWESSDMLLEIFGIDDSFIKDTGEWMNLFLPLQYKDLIRLFNEKVSANKKRGEYEYKIKRQNDGEERWLLIMGDLEFDNDGKPLVLYCTVQDITERKLREQEKLELEGQLRLRNSELEKVITDLKQMQNTLVQAEKMASLGQLSAGIAHEINNPLAFVSSNVNRIQEYFNDTLALLNKWKGLKEVIADDVKIKKEITGIEEFSRIIDFDFIMSDFEIMMGSIQEGLRRIKKIVEGMRGFAHTSQDSFSFSQINSAIDDTLIIVWNELKYKANVEKEYGDLPPLYCNIDEIKQVLVNLLVNAAHSIKEKGTIRIITLKDEDFVYVRIIDSGCGISQNNLKRIFDPFFTTKPIGKGSGLGLWISASIIEKHGGSITVESREEQGSTFTIKLPIHQQNKITTTDNIK